MNMARIVTCAQCWRTFVYAGRGNVKYCSHECRRKAMNRQHSAYKRRLRDMNPKSHFSYAVDKSTCTDKEIEDVMRVVMTIPETKRWRYVKDWPSRKMDILREVYKLQHGI